VTPALPTSFYLEKKRGLCRYLVDLYILWPGLIFIGSSLVEMEAHLPWVISLEILAQYSSRSSSSTGMKMEESVELALRLSHADYLIAAAS
jgi:hypothetical protein